MIVKRKSKVRQILGFCQRAEKAVENKGDDNTPIVIWALGTVPKSLERRLEGLEIRGRNEITEIIALLVDWRSEKNLLRILNRNFYSIKEEDCLHSTVCL